MRTNPQTNTSLQWLLAVCFAANDFICHLKAELDRPQGRGPGIDPGRPDQGGLEVWPGGERGLEAGERRAAGRERSSLSLWVLPMLTEA